MDKQYHFITEIFNSSTSNKLDIFVLVTIKGRSNPIADVLMSWNQEINNSINRCTCVAVVTVPNCTLYNGYRIAMCKLKSVLTMPQQ